MNRRHFLKSAAALAIYGSIKPAESLFAKSYPDIPREFLFLGPHELEAVRKGRPIPDAAESEVGRPVFPVPEVPADLKTDSPPEDKYIHKMRHFNQPHPGDVRVPAEEMPLLKSCARRLRGVRAKIGYGNFYLVSLDDALRIADRYPDVGAFTNPEVAFLEKTFYTNAITYGFFGDKTLTVFTHQIRKKEVRSIAGTGNYLYRGEPVATYRRIQNDIGEHAVLTSGIRSVMKQFELFLNKTIKCQGNLSMASRSIAPPGYSYHGISDFDVGQKGYGLDNFTAKFTQTDVFKKLKQLDYITLRYNKDNMLGVRFEPWHIKIEARG